MSRTHPEAEADIRAAWLWYLNRSPQAAERFEAELRSTLAAVEEGPERWPKGPLGTRRCLLRKFPYAVIYTVDEQGLLVLAVAHGRRSPGFWLARVGDKV